MHVNFLFHETWGREDLAQVLKLEKHLQEVLQKGTWDRVEQRGSSRSLDVRHALTQNGAMKVDFGGWMVTISKGNSGRGRERANDRGSQVRGGVKGSSN